MPPKHVKEGKPKAKKGKWVLKQPKTKPSRRLKTRPPTTRAHAKKVVRRAVRESAPKGSSLPHQLALAMALPLSTPNLRLKSTAGDNCPTAAMALHYYAQISQPQTAATYTGFAGGNSYVALFRDPLRAAILFTANHAAALYSYQAYFYYEGVTGTQQTLNALKTSESVAINPLNWKATTTFAPHGNYLFPGLARAKLYTWLDLGTTITFTQTTGDSSAILQVYTYDGASDNVDAIAVTFSSATATFVNSAYQNGGYFSFAYLSENVSPPSPQSLSAVLSGNGDVFAHLALPNAYQHLNQLTQARIVAASLMVTPTAAQLYRGGTVQGAWLEGSNLWTGNTTSSALTNLPNANTQMFSLTKGMYAFLKPRGITELAYRQATRLASGNITSSSFMLDDPSSYVAMVVTCDYNGASGSPGLEFLLTLEHNVEALISDEWVETHSAPGLTAQHQTALDLVGQIPVFHENPLHFKDIVSAVGSGFRGMRRHAGTLAKAIGVAFPSAAGPAMAGAAFLQSLPEW